jgi:hypothetical protein
MNYLRAFMDAERSRAGFGNTYPEALTKPTEPGFAGFVSGLDHALPESDAMVTGEPGSGNAYPEAPAEPAKPIPDRSVWRSVVATWDIPQRQRWGDLAEEHQVAGKGWQEAEWLAFIAVQWGQGEEEPGPDSTTPPSPQLVQSDIWSMTVRGTGKGRRTA